MAIPFLLGLMGAAAAGQIGKQFLDEWGEDRATARASDRAQGVLGQLGPGAGGMSGLDQALYGSGQLGPRDVSQNVAAMQRQQLSTMPGLMGANLDQAKWDYTLAANQKQTDDETAWLKSRGYDNPFLLGIPSARDSLIQSEIGRMTPKGYEGELSWSTPDIVMGALQGVESGGVADPWQASGPMIEGGAYAGQQAYGPYQVMPGNIPDWTEEATGTRWDPEALVSQARAGNGVAREVYQRTVRHQVEKLQRQGYSDQDVASIWHSGRPLSQSTGARDRATGLPTQGAGDSYISRFGANIGRGTAQAAARREGALGLAEAGLDEERQISTAQEIIDNVDALPGWFGRNLPFGDSGSRVLSDEETLAKRQAFDRAYEASFMDWKKQNYGEAEPTVEILRRFQEAYGDPYAGPDQQRAFVRNIRLDQAKAARANRYKKQVAAVKAGQADASTLDGLSPNLTPTEMQAILMDATPQAAAQSSGSWSENLVPGRRSGDGG